MITLFRHLSGKCKSAPIRDPCNGWRSDCWLVIWTKFYSVFSVLPFNDRASLCTLNRHAFMLVQQLLCSAAQVRQCHRVTQPVISTNIAVRGAARLLPTLEWGWAGSLVMPVPLLSFLFFLSWLNLADTLLSVQLYSCTEQPPLQKRQSSSLVLVLNS